jgi:hypothetical protein
MVQAAVESLYPSSHKSLKAHLCRGMVDIGAKIRYWEHRQGKLNTRRPVDDSAPRPRMETIQEDAPAATPTGETTRRLPSGGPVAQLRQSQNLPPESDPSTINTQQMSRFMNRHLGVAVPTEQRKTSSVQVQQANYPRPHVPELSNLFQCEWCSELFDKKQISESDWRCVPSNHTIRVLSDSPISLFPGVMSTRTSSLTDAWQSTAPRPTRPLVASLNGLATWWATVGGGTSACS